MGSQYTSVKFGSRLKGDVEERPAVTISQRRRFLEHLTGTTLSDSIVRRLMKRLGFSQKTDCGGRRRKARTTLRSSTERTPPAPDLVQRNYTPEAPDRLWVADITYVRTWEGWLYFPLTSRASTRPGAGTQR